MKEKIKPSEQQQKTSPEKEQLPWYDTLELKDLLNPITISRLKILQLGVGLLVLLGGSYYVWDNFLRQPTGLELVGKMVDAAGGMEAWNTVEQGHFTRTQYLYGQNGEALSEIAQTFYFKKTNEGVKLKVAAHTTEGHKVQISKDGEGYWALKADLPADPRLTAGDLGMMCDSQFCNPDCAASMAFYRFSMPFKLTDPGVRPDMGSKTDLVIINIDRIKEFFGMDLEPLVLDVGYRPTVGRDRWKFYVHPENNLIYKIEYINKSDSGEDRPEEMFWKDHRLVDGITFSHEWLRYWGNGKVMERYVFSDVDFKTPLEADIFERPEGYNLLSDNSLGMK